MKKVIKLISFAFIMFLLLIPNTYAKENVNLYLFWGDGCPHCEAEQEFLTEIEEEFPNLKITKYEVWHNQKNQELLNLIASKTNQTLTGVPVTIIGQTTIKGFATPTEQEIKRAVEYYSKNKHQDIVKEIQNGTYKQTEEISDREFKKHEKELNKNTSVTLPIIKEVNFKNYDLMTAIPILGILASLSLPVLWLIIAFISSVNLQEKKQDRIKMLTLGIAIVGLLSIFTPKIQIDIIKWIAKILIILISATLVIYKQNYQNLSNRVIKLLLILLAIAIGCLSTSDYITIMNTLIELEDVSLPLKIVMNLSYILAYIIPYILIGFIASTLWKKIQERGQELLQIIIFILTIPIIIFI